VVLGLIFFLKWGSRRLFALPAAGRSSRTVQVLTRSVLAPRQQVMLLQVGRRVLVVADSGSQMSNLCEITDPDEVAALLGQIRSEKESAANAFGSLLGRVRKGFGKTGGRDADAAADDLPESAARLERAQLLGPPADEPDDDGPGDEETPPDIGLGETDAEAAVAAARQELDGLREKLREVSRQFSGTAVAENGKPRPNAPNGSNGSNGAPRPDGKSTGRPSKRR
jgi:flagellar biogenesis protein FliO